MLTAIIPTKNEEKFLPNCLASVSFADEILVLDSGSTDKTVEIATKFGARVVSYKWSGFKYAHEYGSQMAKGDWLLYVDADERVSSELKNQIIQVLKTLEYQAYQVKRKNFIMGNALKNGGWYPDRVTRLVKKTALKSFIGDLHEYPDINGEVGLLDADLYHLTHRGIDWSLDKTRTYTKMSAKLLLESGHPKVRVKNFFGAMGREFWFRAVSQSGWKDGIVGWIEIIYQTFNAFLIQVHLWEMQQVNTMEEKYRKLDEEIGLEINNKK